MKKIQYLLFAGCIVIVALLASCQVDNYDAPDATLTGRVIDRITNQPIISEQPEGYRIKLEEISWSDAPVAQYFWGKADGTFNHTKLFAGTYKVTPGEGAFVTPDAQTLEVKSGTTTTADFVVTPYISFTNVTIVKSGNSIVATFTLSKNVTSAAPRDYRVFATYKTPYVGTNVFDADVFTDEVLAKGPIALTDTNFGQALVVTLDKLVAGKKYFVRIGARCDNPSSRYNFSEIFTIQM